MYPKLFEIGGLTLRSFTLAFVLAMLGALAVARSEARRRGWSVPSVTRLVVAATLVGFLGAHVLFAITRLHEPWPRWWRILLNVGYGGVWYGGVLAAWPLVHIYATRHKIGVLALYDVAALSILVAQAIGRIGCLLGGCCYGTPTTLPWGVVLSNPDYAGTPLHPIPLYESAYLTGLFLWLWRGRASRPEPGRIAAFYLVANAAGRFLLEFLRGDRIRGFVWGWLSTSQFIAILLAIAGALLYVKVMRQTAHASSSLDR
jgi:phosphatidylglycerol:prolipoprotein diacylglycerol transferase